MQIDYELEYSALKDTKVPGFVATREEAREVVAFWVREFLALHFGKFFCDAPVDEDQEQTIRHRMRDLLRATGSNALFINAMQYGCRTFGSIYVPRRERLPWTVFVHGDEKLRKSASRAIKRYGDVEEREKRLLDIFLREHRMDPDGTPYELERLLDTLLNRPPRPHRCVCREDDALAKMRMEEVLRRVSSS